MFRTIGNGVLLLAVVGAGYWYLSSEAPKGSAELLNTPLPSALKGEEHSRVAKAKATLKTATRPEAKSPESLKLAEAKEPKKDSSNKPFAGLKASSLVKAKPDTKPESKAGSRPKVVAKTTQKPKAQPAGSRPKVVAKAQPAAKAVKQGKVARSEAAQKPKIAAQKEPEKKPAASSTPAMASAALGNIDRVPSTPVQGFSLRRVALAYEVENREPSRVSDAFEKGTRVHFFMDAKNISDDDLELVVHWHDPAMANPVSVELKVPAHAGRYRTWANSSPIHRTGTHEVSVQVKDGPEIYRKSFTVAAAKPAKASKPDTRAAR